MQYLIDISHLPPLKNKIIYFYSNLFNYHEKYQSMISKIENHYLNLNFFAINIDNDFSLIKRFNLKSAPTIIIYKNNKEVEKFTGVIFYKDFLKKISVSII